MVQYQHMLTESFDTLREDGAANGRLLALNLHPWLLANPSASAASIGPWAT